MTKNWYLKTIAQERTATGEKFQLITDVPCHLWMRYSFIPPKTHRIERRRRGLLIRVDLYFCFDVYKDNEQEEPGDTLIHTFIKEPWPYCQERWYYFHGEIGGKPSKSTTAIFYKHPKKPTISILVEQCWWGLGTNVFASYNAYCNAPTFVAQTNYSITKLTMEGCRPNLPANICGPTELRLATVSGNTMGPVIAVAPFNSCILPKIYPAFIAFDVDIPPTLLIAGHEYALQMIPVPSLNPNKEYYFRSAPQQPPINLNRSFASTNQGATWAREPTGTYNYFSGKFYGIPE